MDEKKCSMTVSWSGVFCRWNKSILDIAIVKFKNNSNYNKFMSDINKSSFIN